ncbi:hypothetical protein [Flavobacterium sp. 7A]|uniref:hypothetical protein n=1 Tax=Flavobacterium sp. 7A TaxID=2940571 RepID=UPI002226A0B9|nr:hypothetical protein [Flavobacterium sp. 7A]MCW2119011.1 hypothetical protein [Flavobacterium sp. 7A]
MKQITITLLVFFTMSMAFAQDKYQMKKINYFVDAAQKEFNLNKNQTKELLDNRTAYFNDYQKVFSAAKNGEISQSEKKTQVNEVNNKFNKYFNELTGKTWDELKQFNDRVREEMKEL